MFGSSVSYRNAIKLPLILRTTAILLLSSLRSHSQSINGAFILDRQIFRFSAESYFEHNGLATGSLFRESHSNIATELRRRSPFISFGPSSNFNFRSAINVQLSFLMPTTCDICRSRLKCCNATLGPNCNATTVDAFAYALTRQPENDCFLIDLLWRIFENMIRNGEHGNIQGSCARVCVHKCDNGWLPYFTGQHSGPDTISTSGIVVTGSSCIRYISRR